MVGPWEVVLGDAELGLGDGDAELGGVLGAPNVGALLDVAAMSVDEVHATSTAASAIIPMRADSFLILPPRCIIFRGNRACILILAEVRAAMRRRLSDLRGFLLDGNVT